MKKKSTKTTKKKAVKKAPPPIPSKPEEFYTWIDNHDIMKEFKIGPRTLYNWRRFDYIPHTKIGKKTLYNRSAIEKILRDNSQGPDIN